MQDKNGKQSIVSAVKAAADSVADRVCEIRQDIHTHPELRYQEHRTAALCAAELERLGIEVRTGVGGTGVVGVLRGKVSNDGPTVALRAEMDGLPMEDLCGAPYQSVNPGVAHLCGHDGHVAAVLGAASVLAGLRDRLSGNVKFLFEPAEEATPEGEIPGAAAMINDGALDTPEPDAVYGAHFYPDWPAGSIALRSGPVFTGNDRVKLTVIGKESHTAVPHNGVDALLVASHVVSSLQSLAAQFDIGEAVSMHFSTVHGGRAPNLIAERVDLEGTFRISDQVLRKEMPARVRKMVKGICEAFGATFSLDYQLLATRPVVSTTREVEIAANAVEEVLGPEHLIWMRHPKLAADTMNNWLERTPGAFFMVGTANENPSTQFPSHHQKFDIAPETWPAVVAAESMIAVRYLEQSAE